MEKVWRGYARRVTSVLLALFAVSAAALPERNVSLDIGAGLPNTAFAEAQVLVTPRLQFGFAYGMLPVVDALLSSFQLPSQDFNLATGIPARVTPSLTGSFSTLSPFVRYYPRENNFYLQFSLTLIQLKLKVTGDLTEQITGQKVGLIGANLTVTQPLPTLSVGYLFSGHEYYINFSIGASFFTSAFTSIELTGLIPDALGGTDGNQSALGQIRDSFNEGVNNATAEFRNAYPIMPSLIISFGFNL